MIQLTWQPESTLFPVSALVPAMSLTASDLRQPGYGSDPAESGACVPICGLSTNPAEGALGLVS
jgi:hypothetical protein